MPVSVRRMLFAALGLLLAHAFAIDADEPGLFLPVAYLLATAAIVITTARRPRVSGLAMLPPLVAMTALTSWWGIAEVAPRTWCIFVAGAALGYLGLAERDQAHARQWLIAAAGVAVVALIAAYAVDGARWERPATLAMLLGTTHQTASRVLARFARANLIALEGRTVVILRPDQLRRLGEQ